MGGSSSSPLSIGTEVLADIPTGGLYSVGKYFNDKRIDANRQMRTAANQQKDAMVAQEAALKKKKLEDRNTAANLAMRQRLIAQRGYSSSSTRSGTILTSPTGIPGSSPTTGTKSLLGT